MYYIFVHVASDAAGKAKTTTIYTDQFSCYVYRLYATTCVSLESKAQNDNRKIKKCPMMT